MKRLFTFLMTTLVLLVVSTQGLRAVESVYLQTGGTVNGVKGDWNENSAKISAHKFTYVSGETYRFDVKSCDQTNFYFRVYVASWGDKHIAPSTDKTPISISEEGSTPVSVDWVHKSSATQSWLLDYSKASSYEYLTIYVDLSEGNKKVWVVGKAKSSVTYVLKIDGAISDDNTNGEFFLDLTSETANKAITFTVAGESYGLSEPGTVSAAGTTIWNFASGNTNALTLSKGLSYKLTLTPTTKAAKAASAYTLKVVATAPTFKDYYLVGRLYSSAAGDWSDENADGLKFTTTDGKIYTRSVLCSADNSNFAFRIGKEGDKQLIPSGVEIAPSEGTAAGNITEVNKKVSNNCWKLPITKNNLYTFTLDVTDANNPTLKYEVEAVSGEYEMVATCGTKKLVLPLSGARYRAQNNSEDPKLDDNLWTVGFKDDQLEGESGDVFQVYIQNKGVNKIQFRPNENTNGYGNFDKAWGNSRIEELKLKDDCTNLEYFGNKQYADPVSNSTNTFSITKGAGQSYMLMLNLGGAIEAGGEKKTISFAHKGQSVSLFVYSSLSETYKKLYKNKTKKDDYNEKTQDFYLIGQVYKNSYESYRITEGAKNNKMVRQIYLNPKDETKVDSIVYSKIVKRPTGGLSTNNIFLSFVPSFFWDVTGFVLNGQLADQNGGTKTNTNPFNYIARAATFDEKDATAPCGTVMVRGVDNPSETAQLYSNGEQAINPLINDEDKKRAFYIVRFNVTTSTYRIEFVDEPKITLKHVQTFCSQSNLRLDTKEVGDQGVHAYVVHDFNTTSKEYEPKQGTLELRSLKFIPANMGVVLYCEAIPDGSTVADIPFSIITDADDDEATRNMLNGAKETWWKNAGNYEDEFKNYLVACFDNTIIENGVWSMEGDKYKYAARNFALNKFSNTRYFQDKYPTEAEREEAKKTEDYYSFFRAKGKVPGGRAYLQLPSSVMDFDGQLLDHQEDDNTHFAKMSLFFDDLGGEITGIQEVNANITPREDGAYYTLQGMKVEKPVKGLYIHNGKKVIIK